MNVPFVDLYSQYLTIREEIDAAIRGVIEESAFIRGPYVRAFEEAFAAACGANHCIGVANGTDAIYITLKMLGIGPGDEVITAANSWISTSETISQAGATPVFVDIEPAYYTLDPTEVEKTITARTRAVIPVHLQGQCADLGRIKALCDSHGLYLIEDCAQAHLATYDGQQAGTFGAAGTFSFYPGKNLGAYGDAGAIVTNDDVLAEQVRMYANHGALKKHHHFMEGINSRLDGLQAAILGVKLKHLETWTVNRIRMAHRYNALLEGIEPVVTPVERPGTRHTFHLYVIRAANRDRLREHLSKRGIATGIHYPTILPLLPAYAYLGYQPSDFPVCRAYQDEILSLPLFPELTESQCRYVVGAIEEFYEGPLHRLEDRAVATQ